MSSGAGFDGPGVVEVVPESPTRLGSNSILAPTLAPSPPPGSSGVSVRRERLIGFVVALLVACITYPALIPDVGWELDHSWAAALHMARAKASIRFLCGNEESGYMPNAAELVERIDRELSRDNPHAMFITLLLAVVSPGSGDIEWCNAGHNPPCIMSAEGAGRIVGYHFWHCFPDFKSTSYACERTANSCHATLCS